MAKENTVNCLGKTFAGEDDRREYFRSELRKKLPELKKMEGFPIGEDDDIITLSDPPYFTACPNPWLNDFLEEFEKDKAKYEDRVVNHTVSEPYGYDVKEGVSNPIYTAHSYHTKVPHLAIMRFLLHYTQPGDIVLDSFAGTGMCGVAANACEAPDPETKYKIESEWKTMFGAQPVWGRRRALISDLSPIAAFIAYNYNSPVETNTFREESEDLLAKAEEECLWMFETRHSKTSKGRINYVVWSECLACPTCGHEIVLYDAIVTYETGMVAEEFDCPGCHSHLLKGDCDKIRKTEYDNYLGKTVSHVKYEPVLINYSVGKKRHEKKLDEEDLVKIKKINDLRSTFPLPTDRMPPGDESRRNDRIGIENVHQFYTRRNLFILAKFFELAGTFRNAPKLRFILTSMLPKLTNLNRYMPQHGSRALVGPMANTLYLPSLFVENNSFDQYLFQHKKIVKALRDLKHSPLSVHSATKNLVKDNSVDYVFTDPPFGANIMYSELNFLSESWIRVRTSNKEEAIENKTQSKSKLEYQHLMTESFSEYYRILKPGKWMTIEFSNTSAAIWNAIQTAVQRAGFVISSVTAIDNTRGGLHAMLGPTAVKQNLIISCYKPTDDLIKNLKAGLGESSVWQFVENHLKHLPVHLKEKNQTTGILERNPKVIYDRLVSFFVLKGLSLPVDAREFHEGLRSKFEERDGMFFTKSQAIEYEEKKATAPRVVQQTLIITTESDGIEWLREELNEKKQTYQNLHTKWIQAITAIRKGDILPELKDMLEQNFIQDSEHRWRVPDLNEAKDREALRNKALSKEFEGYLVELNDSKSKKLKEVRVEALRTGFKSRWEKKDFHTIVLVSERIPQNILLEDEQLLMYYDIAKDRV